jgi:hypothetical protein
MGRIWIGNGPSDDRITTHALKSSWKEWSQDLHDIFTYMQTKKPELKGRATEILDVLFNNTVHSGHSSHVQFGMKKKIFQQNNSTLSLVILTWLQQLQQYFLNKEEKDKNGDWNNFRKYTGTTANNLKDTTPLANINFFSVSTPNVLTQITKIKQFKPFEEIKGVYTSLEEWALHILQPDQEFQLKELYDNDPETAQRWDRVMEWKKCATFKVTTKVFTAAKDNIDGNTDHDKLDGLDNNANRHEGQSNQELALIVNTALIKSLQKAEKQKKLAKTISPKELTNMKKAYDAASAFTTIMSNTLDKSIPYKDFEEMNQDMLRWVNLTIEENPTGDGDKNSSNNSSSEDEAPPPKKNKNQV